MKNFTNNFKQFTSRLSARWLIMALMMLVGTSSAWAVDYYLRGTFNNWTADNKFSNNTCTITLEANKEYTFKIADSGWNNSTTYGKTNSNITETCEIELLNNTNNQAAGDCKITTKDAGSYTFVFTQNGSKGTLKVTYPTAKTYTATIKFKRPSSWANTPHIHMFYDGSNTLVDNKTMTEEGVDASGNTWFTYTYNVTTVFTNATIMFNNGGWNNGQTAEQFKGDLGKDYCLASATSTTSKRGDVATENCPEYCTSPAVPTLSADKTSLVSPETATLTAGNTTNGLTYTLYNGTTAGESKKSTGSDLTFTVSAAGSYTVQVTNDCGTSVSTPAVEVTVCTPQTNEFRHANSSYTQLANQPTYYPGDKAYFVSTITCCLTGTWSANLDKGEEGWWTGLTGSTPKFSMTLTRAG